MLGARRESNASVRGCLGFDQHRLGNVAANKFGKLKGMELVRWVLRAGMSGRLGLSLLFHGLMEDDLLEV